MSTSYSATILEHFRNPRNYGNLEGADIVREAYNPVCGDRVRLALRLDGAAIAEARFKGDACAISKAAASVLTELVRGRTLAGAGELRDGELLAALEARIPPGRLQCALLPLQALREGIAGYLPSPRPRPSPNS